MDQKRLKFVIVCSAGIVLLALFGIFCLPWLLLHVGIWLSPAPAEPEIRSGEFPFVLEYRIDGEVISAEDVLICEYSGSAVNEGVGKYRNWQSRLASGDQYLILAEFQGTAGLREDSEAEDDGCRTVIYFYPGSAAYCMGDNDFQDSSFPDARYYIERKGVMVQEGIISAAELSSRYGIELTRWTMEGPIENRIDRQA